jgi:hypothetical protein
VVGKKQRSAVAGAFNRYAQAPEAQEAGSMAIIGRDHIAALYEATASIFEVAVDAELHVQAKNNEMLPEDQRKPLQVDYLGLLTGIRARLLNPEIPSGGPLEDLAKEFLLELKKSREVAEVEAKA